MQTVTIKDIAKALNLSTSTVSRALRGSHEINTETKRLVLEYAEKLNYRPNPIALSLKESRSRAIGVIVPEIDNNFFSQAINGIEAIAYNRGYHVMIFQSQESYEREVVNVEHMVARKVDGILISLSGYTADIAHLKEPYESGMPLVFFDRFTDQIATHTVIADNFDGAYQATKHLIKSGRKRIALLTSLEWLSITQERMGGYKAALQEEGIPIDKSLIRHCGFSHEELLENVDKLLALDPPPDACFTTSDRLALSSLTILKEKKIRIPEQISFIGFTNVKIAHLIDPPLTTVVQPAFEIGQTAAELLFDLIEEKQKATPFKHVKLPTTLHVRSSS